MKQCDSLAGRQTLHSLRTSWFISAAALTTLALIASPAAKADVAETFNLSGYLGTFFGSPVAYTGQIDLDFSDSFSSYTVPSVSIKVNGRSVFDQAVSLSISPSVGVVSASNSTGDSLALWFAAPQSGTWAGFDAGGVNFGYLVFGDVTGSLIGADGVVQRDLSGPVILDPPVDPPPSDPPPSNDPTAAVPELSTWAMMLIGLAGLGLASTRRRALALLRRRV